MDAPLYPDRSSPPDGQIALRFKGEAELPLVDKPLGRDVSALAVIGHTLFCAGDETSTVERLLYDDAAGAFGKHENLALGDFFDLPGGPRGEMDIEGLAAADGYLWITGSHSLKRHGPDDDDADLSTLERTGWDPNRGFLGRVPLVETSAGVFDLAGSVDGKGGKARSAGMMRMGKKGRKGLRKLVREDRLLVPFMNVPAKENGFDVEGLAVMGDRVLVGLRGPVIGTNSLLISMRLDADGRHLEPRMEDGRAYRLHSLDLGGFGIRDLLADGERLLVLAGPTQAIEGVQRVFSIDGFDPDCEVVPAGSVREVLTLPMRGGCDHAEGIARFDLEGKELLLVDYDSPAEDRYDEARHELLLDAYPFPR